MKRVFLFVVMAVAANLTTAATLTVQINNLQNKNGQVLVGLFNSKETFPTKNQEYKGNIVYPISGSTVTTTFNNIPQGDYAVAVIHDEDRSGTLTKNIFGLPTEQYGFSNNVYGKFGPPAFESTRFSITKDDLQITINLK